MRYVLVFLLFAACKPNLVLLYPIAPAPALTPPLAAPEGEDISPEFPPYDDTWEDIDGLDEEGRFLISKSETFILGDDRLVGLSVYQRKGIITMINLHDNENTSVHAAKIVIDSLGGKLMQLRHTGERNIQFRYKGAQFEFDPNRIFTDKGATETMKSLGLYSSEAHQLVRQFANILVDSIKTEVIFTLHNNSEDNYSAASYLDEFSVDALDVYLNPNRDPDDFFFVTERLFFEEFRSRGYNVVLQNNHTMTDDGSLSVLAGQRGIPYINIEAQHDHLREQVEMLYLIYELFR